jgi:hypothetical protein
MLAEYAVHPEAKSNGPEVRPCNRQTLGMLARRPVTARTISHIGKEANRLEDTRAGSVQANPAARRDSQLVRRPRSARLQKLGTADAPKLRRAGGCAAHRP